MHSNRLMHTTLVFGTLLVLTLASVSAFSADLNWRGRYNFEGVSLANPTIDNSQTKEYFMHHLIMKPKIIAADGLNIYGRFDLMNNEQTNTLGYKGGDYLGRKLTAVDGTGGPDGTTSQTSDAGMLEINQLYFTWLQEQGSLIAGRMPLEFGIGLALDAGEDPFDHYLDNLDGVGYKIMIGNLYFLPIYGKHRESSINQGDESYQYMAQLQYENPDTELSLGLLYDVRVATPGGNDAVGGPYDPTGDPATESADGEWKSEHIGLHVGQTYPVGRLDIEAAFYKASTGIETGPDEELSVDSFGIVGQFVGDMTDKKVGWAIQGGYLTGDDPDTDDSYEGFVADRNFDVATILFNHPIGPDALGSRSFYLNNRNGLTNAQGLPDVETLTNAMFIAPEFKWQIGEKWQWNNKLVFAQLTESQSADDTVDLGTEWDSSFVFKPHDGMTWSIDGAVLLPGQAFGNNLNPVYGIQTRAAISF